MPLNYQGLQIGGGGVYAAIGARIWYVAAFHRFTGNQHGLFSIDQMNFNTLYVTIFCGTFRLPPNKVGMIVDRGHDFPGDIQTALEHYGPDMWLFRDNPDAVTTRAVNIYQGDHRG